MTVQTHSILIVDDNPELAKSLGKLLAEHNFGWKQPAAAVTPSGSCAETYMT